MLMYSEGFLVINLLLTDGSHNDGSALCVQ